MELVSFPPMYTFKSKAKQAHLRYSSLRNENVLTSSSYEFPKIKQNQIENINRRVNVNVCTFRAQAKRDKR